MKWYIFVKQNIPILQNHHFYKHLKNLL